MEPHADYAHYPEAPLCGRMKLAYDWIPEDSKRLLDGGCSFGYGTRHFKNKTVEAWGVDPNPTFIDVASKRYPDISFKVGGLESTSFENGYFDTIILNDVLEHVASERKTLSELYRIMAVGGRLTITTPHRGLFSFLDNENFVFHMRTKTPRLYRLLFRLKYGTYPASNVKPGYEELHRHYSLRDMVRLLDNSDFKGHYKIQRVFRSGFFLGVFRANLNELMSLFFGFKTAAVLVKPLDWPVEKEYFVSFGPLAWHIAVQIEKTA